VHIFLKWGRDMSDVVTDFSKGMHVRSGSRPPRSFAILRVGKIKTKGHLGAALGHNYRERETPNADQSRMAENLVLKGPGTAQGVMEAWDARAPEKIRKNAVHALEYFVGGSPERVHAMGRDEQNNYFRRALDWLKDRHGAENVLSAVVHRDETTPHMQVLVIPLDARGKLNARELVGGKDKLRQMQTDFARDVGQPFGLERGQERSRATHQTIQEYYGRASTPIEADFSLPERRRGAVMGLGGESDREWQERASRAATERLAHLTAHLTEASGTLRREMEATEAVLGQTQTELARERAMSEAANKLVLTALQIPQIEGVTEDDKQDLLRDMARFHNRHASHFSDMQAKATKAALNHTGIAVIELKDGSYALPWRDFDAVGGQRLAGTDRQGADAILNGLRQAERSRQQATEAMHESEARKTRERERGQDSGSDWG